MRELGIALLGYGFMGRAHSLALRALRGLEPEPAALPSLVSVCGRDREAVERMRNQHGWRRAVCNWREQVDDDEVALFDNTGPNALHLDPTLAAIANGKHVLCEKPLASNADDAHRLWRAAEEAGVVHMCGFNYRFMPAVRHARELVESGELGEPIHFRARFLASSALSSDQRRTWRFQRAAAGSGALGDLGSHIIDLARYLVGEPVAVSAATKTFVPERDGEPADVDDAFTAVVEFDGGALGTLEGSRVAGRLSNVCAFELDASRASLAFDVQRLNELELLTTRKESRRIEITDAAHPFMQLWWPAPGHTIGWGDSFTHEMRHFLAAATGEACVAPYGADFEDGYRCAEVCDAVLRASSSGVRQAVRYRPSRMEQPQPAQATIKQSS